MGINKLNRAQRGWAAKNLELRKLFTETVGRGEVPTQSIAPVSPFCRVYKCANRIADNTGYCVEHVSPLRTGRALYTAGSAPVVHKTFKD